MKVGRMNDSEVEEFVARRLERVKGILDEIAEKTGITYLVMSEQFAEMFGKVGLNLISGIQEVMKIVPDRLDLANKANQAAFEANFEERERSEKRREMRGLLDALIARSKDDLRADLEELKEKYGAFDVEGKK